MNKLFKLIMLICLVATGAQAAAELPEIETESFDKEDFVFPDDLEAPKLNVVFLAVSNDQDNGTWQGERLLDWQVALDQQDFFDAEVVGYHFAVFKAPFFVKGMIRNGMRENYEGKVPLDQVAILWMKADKFAAESGFELDEQPTIAFVSPDKRILKVFKGEVSGAALAEVIAAAEEYRTTAPAAQPVEQSAQGDSQPL